METKEADRCKVTILHELSEDDWKVARFLRWTPRQESALAQLKNAGNAPVPSLKLRLSDPKEVIKLNRVFAKARVRTRVVMLKRAPWQEQWLQVYLVTYKEIG